MPVARMLGRNEVFQAWTTSPYTKSFRHLLPYNRQWERRMTFRDPIIKSSKPKDRIKYWNIVPGDQVRIRGEESKTIYEVLSINRLSNQVRLKVPSSVSTRRCVRAPVWHLHETPHSRARKPFLRKCSMRIYNCSSDTTVFYQRRGCLNPSPPRAFFKFSRLSETLIVCRRVFATRISTSKPTWNHIFKRWDWQRFAVNTIPRLTGPSLLDRINVPWPAPVVRERGDGKPICAIFRPQAHALDSRTIRHTAVDRYRGHVYPSFFTL